MTKANHIKSFDAKYRWLSNFFLTETKVCGIIFPSSENAYQALKVKDLSTREYIATLSPSEAKRFSKTIKVRKNWDTLRVKAMWKVTVAKYSQNQELTKNLLQLSGFLIEEGNSWNDTFWGICDGKGKNMLGQIIMAYRDYRLGFVNRRVDSNIQKFVIARMKNEFRI